MSASRTDFRLSKRPEHLCIIMLKKLLRSSGLIGLLKDAVKSVL